MQHFENRDQHRKVYYDELTAFLTADKQSRVEQLAGLKCRWSDEREYEDFDEYKVVVGKIFNAGGFELLSCSKAFTIKVERMGFQFEVKLGARSVKWSALN